jgi:hypothetical protein
VVEGWHSDGQSLKTPAPIDNLRKLQLLLSRNAALLLSRNASAPTLHGGL